MRDLESFFDNDDDEDEEIDAAGLLPEVAQHKEAYYKEKFGFISIDKLSVVVYCMSCTVFYWLLGMSLLSYQPVMWLPWSGYCVITTLAYPHGAGM